MRSCTSLRLNPSVTLWEILMIDENGNGNRDEDGDGDEREDGNCMVFIGQRPDGGYISRRGYCRGCVSRKVVRPRSPASKLRLPYLMHDYCTGTYK